jgi:hypothetical protein
MDHSIRILDYIEDNQHTWMGLSNQIKQQVYDGLEELANYKLTQDSGLDLSKFINSSADTVINDRLELQVGVNCYLVLFPDRS